MKKLLAVLPLLFAGLAAPVIAADAKQITCTLSDAELRCPLTPPPGDPGPGPGPGQDTSEWALCPAGTIKATKFYPSTDLRNTTTDLGRLATGSVLSVRMAVPAGATGYRSVFFGGAYGGARSYVWAITKKACDFDNPLPHPDWDTKKRPGVFSGMGTQNVDFGYHVRPTGLPAGSTYYFNLKITACDTGDCYFKPATLP